MIRRAWSPQIARAFVGAYIVLSIVGGGLLAISQFSLGDRITRVEHTRTVELCSTKVSCRHLLGELVASIGPRERRLIERHFASQVEHAPGVARAQPSAPHSPPVSAPRRVRHRHQATARPAPSPSPLAVAPAPITSASPAAVPPVVAAPAPPRPAPSLPSAPAVPSVTAPPAEVKEPAPLPLPCPRLPVVERLLCH